MILVKNNLSHSPLPRNCETLLQATSIQVSLNKHTKLTLLSAYCPPDPKISINNSKNYFETLGKYFIIAGDLNAKHSTWGFFSTNTRCRTLQNLLDNSNINILLPSHLTYWPSHQNRQPNILDIFIAKIPSNCNTNVSNINDLSSDHSPIILDFEMLSSNTTENSQAPRKIDGPIFKTYRNSLTTQSPLKLNDDINNF